MEFLLLSFVYYFPITTPLSISLLAVLLICRFLRPGFAFPVVVAVWSLLVGNAAILVSVALADIYLAASGLDYVPGLLALLFGMPLIVCALVALALFPKRPRRPPAMDRPPDASPA